MTFQSDFGVYLGSSLGPLGSFCLNFLGSLDGVKIQTKKESLKGAKRPKRWCAGLVGRNVCGPKRRASCHQEAPRTRPRPHPEPDQRQTQTQTRPDPETENEIETETQI